MEVYSLVKTAVSEDGHHVVLTLETDGSPLEVSANAAALGTILQDVSAGLSKAKSFANPTEPVQAATPSRYRVGAAEGGKAVLLSFEMPSSLQHHFALETSHAERLRARIGQALDECKRAQR